MNWKYILGIGAALVISIWLGISVYVQRQIHRLTESPPSELSLQELQDAVQLEGQLLRKYHQEYPVDSEKVKQQELRVAALNSELQERKNSVTQTQKVD